MSDIYSYKQSDGEVMGIGEANPRFPIANPPNSWGTSMWGVGVHVKINFIFRCYLGKWIILVPN